MLGQLSAFVTATRVEFTGEDRYTEEHGWIDLRWSRTDLHESRNDVSPLYSEPCDYVRVPGGVELARPISDQLIEEIRDAFDSLPCHPYRDNGDGTYYSEGDYFNPEDAGNLSYAVHWHIKHFEAGKWIETSVTLPDVVLPMGIAR